MYVKLECQILLQLFILLSFIRMLNFMNALVEENITMQCLYVCVCVVSIMKRLLARFIVVRVDTLLYIFVALQVCLLARISLKYSSYVQKPTGGVQVLPAGGKFAAKKNKEKSKEDKENRSANEQLTEAPLSPNENGEKLSFKTMLIELQRGD